jgi:hypothetical protein
MGIHDKSQRLIMFKDMADVYRKNGGVDSKSLETERNWKKKG